MDAQSREALRIIRACVRQTRYRLLDHFMDQMNRRGLFWGDILAMIDSPMTVRFGGMDHANRETWLIRAKVVDGLVIELVCALDVDEAGDVVVFITMY